MHEVTGAIVRTPGLPPMYDYEFAPQQVCILSLCSFTYMRNAYQQRPFKGVGILMMLMHRYDFMRFSLVAC